MNEAENPREWQYGRNHAERSEDRRNRVERGERDLKVVETTTVHLQPHDTRKGANPTTLFRICHCDNLRALNRKDVCMVRRGVGRIRERRLPRLEAFGRRKLDVGEEVLSGTRNPRFGDEAAIPECIRFIVQVVDDVVEDFCRKGGFPFRHRHFFPEVKTSASAGASISICLLYP